MVVAVLLGWTAVVAGLLISYHYDTAAGATMSGLAVALFFVVLAGREITTRLPHPEISRWGGRRSRPGGRRRAAC
jgi:manganese/iron transport system permease protein